MLIVIRPTFIKGPWVRKNARSQIRTVRYTPIWSLFNDIIQDNVRIHAEARYFLFSVYSVSDLLATKPPLPGAVLLEIKRQGHEADLSSPYCIVKVKIGGDVPPLPLKPSWRGA
jgi:hypothetical protein